MIKCIVCQESKSEEYFTSVRYGGLAICSDCKGTDKAKQLQIESEKRMEEAFQRREAYEQEKAEKKKNQIYDGQYDWM